ncbi:hypothetical protein D3C85_1275190 [compost metagenome]
MYRAELTPSSVALVKVVNGISTVLQKIVKSQTIGQYYDLKVRVRSNHFVIYLDGIPLMFMIMNLPQASTGLMLKFLMYLSKTLKHWFTKLTQFRWLIKRLSTCLSPIA